MDKKRLLIVAALCAVSLMSVNRAVAQVASQAPKNDAVPRISAPTDSQAPSAEEIRLLRKDLQSQKKQMVAANMDLTDAVAEKFWPVYDRYAADMARINDAKAALVKGYLENYTTMTGEQAENYIRKRAAVEESVTQLRLKYIPEFNRVLTGRQTAMFFQIDWRLGLLVDLQLAQMPLIDP
jgi:hypothetical protein